MSRPADRPRRAAAKVIPPPRSARPLFTVAFFRRVFFVVLWGVTIGGVVYAFDRVEPYANSAHGDGRWVLEWESPPLWLSEIDEWVRYDIDRRIEPLRTVDVLTPSFCETMAVSIAESPWIAKVVEVRKRSDGRVRVRAQFRKPLTRIEYEGIDYLVDEAGVRLPDDTARRSAFRQPDGCVYICGVRSDRPGVGERWGGEDVAAGLRLAKYLHEKAPSSLRACLRSVDVANYYGRVQPLGGRLILRTIYPETYIHWGAPPGEEYDMESAAERKLAYLLCLLAEVGSLPDHGTFDVRDPNGLQRLDRARG